MGTTTSRFRPPYRAKRRPAVSTSESLGVHRQNAFAFPRDVEQNAFFIRFRSSASSRQKIHIDCKFRSCDLWVSLYRLIFSLIWAQHASTAVVMERGVHRQYFISFILSSWVTFVKQAHHTYDGRFRRDSMRDVSVHLPPSRSFDSTSTY